MLFTELTLDTNATLEGFHFLWTDMTRVRETEQSGEEDQLSPGPSEPSLPCGGGD